MRIDNNGNVSIGNTVPVTTLDVNGNLLIRAYGTTGSGTRGLFFRSDGFRFYVIGTSTRSIYQYVCGTAWDISTASYDSKSFSVATQDTTPNSFFFKSDGLSFYMIGAANDTVWQYSCSTAWEINASVYADKGYPIGAFETTLSSLCFKDDGTAFYVAGVINNTIYQYTCSTPWDITTSSYANKSYDLLMQSTSTQSIVFKTDGTKFYIISSALNRGYQYACSTPWDVSTATYENKSFSFAAQESNPVAIFFKDDGTKVYMLGSGTDTLYQYTCSTAWEINTASYDSKSFAFGTQEATAQEMFFKPDGTKFYIIGTTADAIFQYSCATAWDISTASYDSKSFSVATQEANSRAFIFKPDGLTFYMVGSTYQGIYQYSCATAWDISTATYSNKFSNINEGDTDPYGMTFKSDGTKFYVLGNTNNALYQYTCNTAWDITTGVYDNKSAVVTLQETSPLGVSFKTDGTKFYIVGSATDRVYQYTCSTAWDVSTASYDSKSFSVTLQEPNPRGIFFKSDGTKFYVLGTSKALYQYSCATAWDVSTAYYDFKFLMLDYQDATPLGIFFKDDGSKFYVTGDVNDKVYQYSCVTAWDISTAGYDNLSVSIAVLDASLRKASFKSDGTKFYSLGNGSASIFQYSNLLQ
jgi:sugar lactone lactonase YvrE